MRSHPRIFDELPDLAKVTPWIPLADVPTAVERCSAIEDWLGSRNVWMKRDDKINSLYGGNKVRRYEFLLADAKERGKKRILIAAIETQMRLHLGKRQRLRLRRMNEGIGHGISGRKVVALASGHRLFLLPEGEKSAAAG